jgi:hypothetical protein
MAKAAVSVLQKRRLFVVEMVGYGRESSYPDRTYQL